jgi:hypothetical protein
MDDRNRRHTPGRREDRQQAPSAPTMREKDVRIETRSIQGDIVVGSQIKNYHEHHHDSGIRVVAPSTSPIETPEGWTAGADVTIGGHVYLLDGRFLAERFSATDAATHREALALRQHPPPRRKHAYAWLRQVMRRGDTPAASRALDALAKEHELLVKLAGGAAGLPRLPRLVRDSAGRTVTLAVAWPCDRSTGKPHECLSALLDPDSGFGPMHPPRMIALLRGLAGLCDILAKLHRSGVTHRCLTPDGIIMLARDRLAVRDLGLAARAPQINEGPALYRAPEQRAGHAATPPGPRTDAYQLAAFTYHLLTGTPPHPRAPLPIAGQVQMGGIELPSRMTGILDAALAPHPPDRPDIGSLAVALRGAHTNLLRKR